MKKTKSFYKTKKWKKKAAKIKKRDGYKCQETNRYGGYHEAEVVHHIFPLEEYPELAYLSWNLLSLSNTQHNKMHDRITNEITDLGKQWQRRRQKEFDEWKKSNSDPPSISKN